MAVAIVARAAAGGSNRRRGHRRAADAIWRTADAPGAAGRRACLVVEGCGLESAFFPTPASVSSAAYLPALGQRCRKTGRPAHSRLISSRFATDGLAPCLRLSRSMEGFMRIAPIAMLGLASLALISCTATIAPVKINAGDQCFRCRAHHRGHAPRQRADPGRPDVEVPRARMHGRVPRRPSGRRRDVFVTDYATGKMIPPAEAIFVPVAARPEHRRIRLSRLQGQRGRERRGARTGDDPRRLAGRPRIARV